SSPCATVHCWSPTSTPAPSSTLFPYTTLFRSQDQVGLDTGLAEGRVDVQAPGEAGVVGDDGLPAQPGQGQGLTVQQLVSGHHDEDRKSTRLNSSHVKISYAVFCLKKIHRRDSS